MNHQYCPFVFPNLKITHISHIHIKITRKWQFKILRKNVAVINLTATLQKAMTAGGQKESMTSFVTLIY